MLCFLVLVMEVGSVVMKYWQRVDGLTRVHSVRSMGSYRFVVVVVVVVV